MGIHLSIVRREGVGDHPDWDFCRHVNDDTFSLLADGLPVVRNPVDEFQDVWRPTDFTAWRAAIETFDCNVERFQQLLDILEADENWWIYVSW